MLKFYSFEQKKNIYIKKYLQTDKLINYKNIFEKNLINFENSIFLNNFFIIDKNILLKKLKNNDNIIIIDKNNKTIKIDNCNNTNTNKTDINLESKYNLLKKYPDLILFIYILNNNNIKEIIYFLEKYNFCNKKIFNIIKNNQNELIELIKQDPNLLVNIFKKNNSNNNFTLSSFMNNFINLSPASIVRNQLEDIFPDVPRENISELINIFKNNILII